MCTTYKVNDAEDETTAQVAHQEIFHPEALNTLCENCGLGETPR